MTLAICWKCGSQKVGALTTCTACRAVPVRPIETATSVLLSDHYRTEDELATLAGEIKRGQPPEFDQAELERVQMLAVGAPTMPWGCTVAVWTPVVLLVLLVIAVGALFLLGAYR
jgi:hypothetical protein